MGSLAPCEAPGRRAAGRAGPDDGGARRGWSVYVRGGDGPIVDWWVYEDVLRRIPLVMACAGFPPGVVDAPTVALRRDAPGCYDRDARLADMDVNRTERSLCFPDLPALRRAAVPRGEGQDSSRSTAVRGVQRLDDRGVVRDSHGRLIPLCLVPLWDPVLAAGEVRRNAARGCQADRVHRAPREPRPALDPRRRPTLGPVARRRATRQRTTICMHIGSGSRCPRTSADAPVGRRHRAHVAQRLHGNGRLAALGGDGAFPEPQDRVLRKPGRLDAVPPRTARSPLHEERSVGRPRPVAHRPPVDATCPAACSAASSTTWSASMPRHQIGIGQLVFETDYPHQDSTWPHTSTWSRRSRSGCPPTELEMLVRTNAIDMLDLDPATSAR